MDLDWIKKTFLPKYDEMTLYLHGIAFFLLFFFGIGFYEVFSTFGFANIIMVLGSFMTIFYAFSKKAKNVGEKHIMLWFMILLNVYAAITTVVIIMEQSQNKLYLILPLINFIHAIIIYFLYKAKYITDENISDENITIYETIFGGIMLLFVILICRFVFKLYWTYTLSISVGYINLLYGLIRNIFWPRNA